jgi:uracil phosphoribosyltransferase
MKEALLAQLRDRTLSMESFRKITEDLARLMAADLKIPSSQKVILIPILRAGLALLPAFQNRFPQAPIGLFGIRRDEQTAFPHLYYENIPPYSEGAQILLLDPMLATGGSANAAIDRLKTRQRAPILLVSILSCLEGIQAIQKRHPDVGLYTVATDPELNAAKYIVPGLGDFGDRYFGTVE